MNELTDFVVSFLTTFLAYRLGYFIARRTDRRRPTSAVRALCLHFAMWAYDRGLRDGRERHGQSVEIGLRSDCRADARKLAETMTEGGQ